MLSARSSPTWVLSVGDGRSALRYAAGLPFERWAVRLSTGHADVRGTVAPLTTTIGGHALTLVGGPAHLELLFVGGRRPTLAAVCLTTALQCDDQAARSLRLVDGEVRLDDVTLPSGDVPLASGDFVTAVLDHLSDVEVTARARPARMARVRLPEGIAVTVSERDEISVRARAHGPPGDLVLAEPLVLHFGEHGVRIDHRNARWLARLAGVRIHGADLHPDGRVVLAGSASRGLNHMVRLGLRTASSHLSGLVRTSPNFQQIRDFLRR